MRQGGELGSRQALLLLHGKRPSREAPGPGGWPHPLPARLPPMLSTSSQGLPSPCPLSGRPLPFSPAATANRCKQSNADQRAPLQRDARRRPWAAGPAAAAAASRRVRHPPPPGPCHLLAARAAGNAGLAGLPRAVGSSGHGEWPEWRGVVRRRWPERRPRVGLRTVIETD